MDHKHLKPNSPTESGGISNRPFGAWRTGLLAAGTALALVIASVYWSRSGPTNSTTLNTEREPTANQELVNDRPYFVPDAPMDDSLDEPEPNQPPTMDAQYFYDQACSNALVNNNLDATFTAIEKSAALGFHRLGDLHRDCGYFDPSVGNETSDLVALMSRVERQYRPYHFESIHDHPRFIAALELVQSNHKQHLEKFKSKTPHSPPRIFVPPGLDRTVACPLILLVHSQFGSNQYWETIACEQAAILARPHVGHERGRHHWQWGDADESDIMVQATMRSILAEFKIDFSRSIITGFSQGGVCALNAGLRHPEWFRGVCAQAPYYDVTLIENIAKMKTNGQRIYLMVGTQDGNIEANRLLAQNLASANAPHKLSIIPRLGHSIPRDAATHFREAFTFITNEGTAASH